MTPKILLFDIETAPNTAYVWGLWQQNVGLNQIVQSGYILSWAAKWLGDPNVMFDSIQEDNRRSMLEWMHALLDDSDIVVHFNGKKFDIPILNKEFVKEGMTPPSPYKQIDLCQVVKQQFRFESNKLDYVTKSLGFAGKVEHRGFSLWIDCMNGVESAWEEMKAYNMQDVVVLEDLYLRLRPWIENHPSLGAFSGEPVCPKCGSHDYQKRGIATTAQMQYQRYQCNSCHGWFRDNKTLSQRGQTRMVNVVSS